MPETKKATLKQQLTAEVVGALSQRPDLEVVKVADGAPDHWSDWAEALAVRSHCASQEVTLGMVEESNL